MNVPARFAWAALWFAAGVALIYVAAQLAQPGAYLVGFDASNWADLHDGNPAAAIARAPVLSGHGLLAFAGLLAAGGCAAVRTGWLMVAPWLEGPWSMVAARFERAS